MYHKLIKWLYPSHFSVKNQGQCRLNELIPCRIDFLAWQVTSKWRISHFISRVNIHAYLYMIRLPLRLLKIIICPRLCVELTKEYTAKERGTIPYYARYLIVKQTILGQFARKNASNWTKCLRAKLVKTSNKGFLARRLYFPGIYAPFSSMSVMTSTILSSFFRPVNSRSACTRINLYPPCWGTCLLFQIW